MNNPVVVYVIVGALAVFFIFLLVMSWKTWRWAHILFSFLVFSGCIAFLVLASAVLKTHTAWRTLHESLSEEVKKLEAEKQKYLYGNLLEVTPTEPSIRSLRADLALELTARGRVWRECTPLNAVDADTFRVRTVPASLPRNATPPPNGISQKDVLYVFAEAETPDGWKVPAAYLGEFVVDAATPTEVTISVSPHLPLDQDQRQRIAQSRSTWTLYEVMPLDGHQVFAQWDADKKMYVGMEKEELAKYIPNQYNWPAAKYQKFLDQYYRFNRNATEDDPPENTWVEVKFVKDHSIQVDSDAAQSLLEGEGRYFDSSGRAVETRVKRGEDGTVQFKAGDTAVFDQDTANTLIGDGICQKVRLVYRRPLHDYVNFFHETYRRYTELAQSIERVKRDMETLKEAKAKADEQIAFRTQEKINLEKDLAGFRKELEQTISYAQVLETEWRRTLHELSVLYSTNNQLVEQLKQLQYRMAQEINRRTLEAAAKVPPTVSSE